MVVSLDVVLVVRRPVYENDDAWTFIEEVGTRNGGAVVVERLLRFVWKRKVAFGDRLKHGAFEIGLTLRQQLLNCFAFRCRSIA